MKTFVSFRSSKFPAYEGEEEEINPGLWGRRLAEYLAVKLREKGVEPGKIILEDWGCYLPVTVDGQSLALCCGHQGGDDDEFLVFTNPDKPRVWRWFRRIDLTPQLTSLTAAVAEILVADPDIHDVVWDEPFGR